MTEPETTPLTQDFDDLEPGATFITSGRTLTEADVVSFAGLTGDFHPQHTDAEWARDSSFGERLAHGMLVLSAAVGLVPLDPDRALALRRVSDAVFKKPVRFGDTIHVEGRLESVREVSEEAGLASWRWRVLNQGSETVVQADVEVLWRRGAVGASASGAPDGGGEEAGGEGEASAGGEGNASESDDAAHESADAGRETAGSAEGGDEAFESDDAAPVVPL